MRNTLMTLITIVVIGVLWLALKTKPPMVAGVSTSVPHVPAAYP